MVIAAMGYVSNSIIFFALSNDLFWTKAKNTDSSFIMVCIWPLSLICLILKVMIKDKISPKITTSR